MTIAPDDHDAAVDLLKSKAMLLLRRERELHEFRIERDRVESWLQVFHALADMIGTVDESGIVNGAADLVIEHLGFEVVAVYRQGAGNPHLTPVCVAPRERSVLPIAIDDQTIVQAGHGTHQATDTPHAISISQSTGLEKFFWQSLPVGPEAHYLLVAGFSPNAAAFHSLSSSDEGHFLMLGNHLAALLRNSDLVETVRMDQRRLVEANGQLRDEMERRERAETELRLAHKLEAVGQLAAGIAHEINTPMQYIGDNIEFLRKAFARLEPVMARLGALRQVGDPSECAVMVDEIREEAAATKAPALLDRIPRSIDNSLEGVAAVTKIVRAMKDFSHPGSDEKQLVDLNHAIDASVTVSRNEWKYLATVDFTADDHLPEVPALAAEINQVLLNLIVNAAHAVEDRWSGSGQLGVITIDTTHDDSWVRIRVSDNGSGIPPDLLDHIFTPFFTTKEVGRGSGQGLAIVHSVVVDRHSGRIDVDSQVGEGTTFTISLPRERRLH